MKGTRRAERKADYPGAPTMDRGSAGRPPKGRGGARGRGPSRRLRGFLTRDPKPLAAPAAPERASTPSLPSPSGAKWDGAGRWGARGASTCQLRPRCGKEGAGNAGWTEPQLSVLQRAGFEPQLGKSLHLHLYGPLFPRL